MAKKKNTWESFINRMLTRKRANREAELPTTYLMSVADSIWKTNPTKEIIYKTLKDVAIVLYEKGYAKKESDIAFFKAKQTKRLNDDFKRHMDDIDDIIHEKSNLKKS